MKKNIVEVVRCKVSEVLKILVNQSIQNMENDTEKW